MNEPTNGELEPRDWIGKSYYEFMSEMVGTYGYSVLEKKLTEDSQSLVTIPVCASIIQCMIELGKVAGLKDVTDECTVGSVVEINESLVLFVK